MSLASLSRPLFPTADPTLIPKWTELWADFAAQQARSAIARASGRASWSQQNASQRHSRVADVDQRRPVAAVSLPQVNVRLQSPSEGERTLAHTGKNDSDSARKTALCASP